MSNLKVTNFEEIYLDNSKFSQVKENFKLMFSEAQKDIPKINTVLDVGCATGDFLKFISEHMKELKKLEGMDILESFLKKAQENIPQGKFHKADIFDPDFNFPYKYDWVICAGVLNYTHNWKQLLMNLMKLCSDQGVIHIFAAYNEEPVDVEVKFKRSKIEDSEWEFRNSPSLYSIDNYLDSLKIKHDWVDFVMTHEIPKRIDDPMRSWTEPFRGNPYFLFQGNGQITTQKILKIWPTR